MSMSIVSPKAVALNCIFWWEPGLRSSFSLITSATRFSVTILGLQMGKKGTKRLYNIIMVIRSFIQLGIDVVLKIKTFAAISWPTLAMPALANNLVDQTIWCWGLFLYAVCDWCGAILMSIHLVPWTTCLYQLCCPRLPKESSSTNLCSSTGCPKKGCTEPVCAMPVSGANQLPAVTTDRVASFLLVFTVTFWHGNS